MCGMVKYREQATLNYETTPMTYKLVVFISNNGHSLLWDSGQQHRRGPRICHDQHMIAIDKKQRSVAL